MITKTIVYEDDLLLLQYEPEFGFRTVKEFLKTIDDYEDEGRSFVLNRTFHIKRSTLLHTTDTDDFPVFVVLGKLNMNKIYYQLDKCVFNIEHDVYFDVRINVKQRHLCYENSSTIGYLSRAVQSDIYVDLDAEANDQNHIPFKIFEECIVKIPTRYELGRYKDKVTEQFFLITFLISQIIKKVCQKPIMS